MTPDTMKVVVLAMVALLLLVATILLLTQLTQKRIGTLAMLRDLLVNKPTYVVSTIAIANEVYSSYKYGTPVNWTGILTILGISTAAVKVGQVQAEQKTAAAAAENIAASTDLVLNTMPVGPKNPVPASRTQVTPTRVPPLPPPTPAAPGSIL